MYTHLDKITGAKMQHQYKATFMEGFIKKVLTQKRFLRKMERKDDIHDATKCIAKLMI